MIDWNFFFEYRDGILYWRYRPANNRVDISKPAGNPTKQGVMVVGLNGTTYQVHKIVYEMHYGELPRGKNIRHLNNDKTDNRIENLFVSGMGRKPPQPIVKRPRKDGHMKHIRKWKGKFTVDMKLYGKKYKKTFPTIEEAAEWRDIIIAGIESRFKTFEFMGHTIQHLPDHRRQDLVWNVVTFDGEEYIRNHETIQVCNFEEGKEVT